MEGQNVLRDNYVVYHLHTELSLLDSRTNYKLYVDKAKELGQKAICFTEHGNIFNWVKKKMYCDEQGIKYMHGVECYLTETLDPEHKIRDNFHTVLIAKNRDGFVELNNLLFKSYQADHRYAKNRISFDEFLNISDNIIKISACLQSPLNKYRKKIEDNYTEEQRDMLVKLLEKYDYYEIQYHNMPEQIEYNQYLYKMSKAFNKKLIVGTDTHSLNDYLAECRKLLMLRKEIAYTNEEECDLTYKSYEEVLDMFEKQNSLPMDIVREALYETNIMADSVEDFSLDTKIKYPELYGEKDEDVMWETLTKKYNDKLEKGIITDNEEYINNVKEEMRVFKKVNMVGFMLFMSELMSWCRDNNIYTSPCRGCFTENALIYTKDNMKPIKDIIVGDEVLCKDGKWHKVINTMSYDICEDLIEFEHQKQGSLRKKYNNQCTLDHKILVNRNGNIDYISAKDLKVGDLLCSPKIKHEDIYKNRIIDLNDYNIFGFDYDDKYIYEEVIQSEEYKYSPRWIEKNLKIVSSAFIKRLANGHIPTKKDSVDKLNKLMNLLPFDTLENYVRYLKKHNHSRIKINRYIKVDHIWNIFIGMMYGDGWTQKNYSIGMAVNRTTKNIVNRNIFYRIANKIYADNTKIYVNSAKNRNLDQLFINSRVLNNYISTNFFKSEKGKCKVFNKDLFNQNKKMLKWLLYGLKITDGSINRKENKLCYNSTSLSIISAYKTLDNIVNCNAPLSIDVRLQHIDKRNPNWINKESYKIRRSIERSYKYNITEDDNYWFLPITSLKVLSKQNTKVYDFTVKDDHSYTINNIVVHNSVGGSTVAFISDIIDVDPVKWHTVFSRFCNEYRKEVGDIDVDIYDDQRKLVYDYIINRFGKEKTAFILSLGTMADKGCIDDICGGLSTKWCMENGIDPKNGKSLSENPYNLSVASRIKDEYSHNPEETKKKYKDVFYYFDGFIGGVTSQSQHPAGIVASSINLIDNYGMFISTKDEDGNSTDEEKIILPIDMDEVHETGLVKYDILGLRNIGVISKTCEYAHIPLPRSYTINWEDENVYKDMLKSPVGIFQFESDTGFNALKKYNIQSIDDMSLVNACIRPSGESYRDRILNHIPNKNPSTIIDELLKNNNGYLVYQEDTIKFLQEICGLSGSDADNVRRAIGRKQVDRLQKALPQILEGYCNKSDKPRDVAEKEAKDFLQIIEDSASYQFGYNHSMGYSMLGYLCAYMRYYHTIEFCTASLNCSKSNEDIYNVTNLAIERGITIQSPKFRYSTSEFSCDKEQNIIYKGIGSIKDIGKNCGNNLYTLKDKKYNNFVDVLYDIKENKLAERGEIDLLIKIDFFREFGEINKLLFIHEMFKKFYGKKTFKKDMLEEYGLLEDDVSLISEKTTAKQFSGVNMKELIRLIEINNNIEKISDLQKICYNLGILGYVNDIDITQDNDIYSVAKIDKNKYGTRFLTLYKVNDGTYLDSMKVNRDSFNEFPCDLGDILKAVIRTQSKRKKNDDGEWIKSKEKENVIKNYSIIMECKPKK